MPPSESVRCGGLLSVLLAGCGGVVEARPPVAEDAYLLESSTDGTLDADGTVESPTDAGETAPVPIDPPPSDKCVRLSSIKGPVLKPWYVWPFLAAEGRVTTFLNESAADLGLADGGIKWFAAKFGYSYEKGLCGAERAASIDGTLALSSLRFTRGRPGDDSSCLEPKRNIIYRRADGMWAGGGDNLLGLGDPYRRNIVPMPVLVYADAKRFRSVDERDGKPVATEGTAAGIVDLPAVAGFVSVGDKFQARYVAVGKYHVRVGEGLAPVVLDLDALTMRPIAGAQTIEGFGAAGLEEGPSPRVWVSGKTASGAPVLQRIDPQAATATLYPSVGLVDGGFTGFAQDLLVPDGTRVWKLRFGTGSVAVSSFEPATKTAMVYRLEGELTAAGSMFIPTPATPVPEYPGKMDNLNGFSPPESLFAARLATGELVVLRQWSSTFAGLRISATCP